MSRRSEKGAEYRRVDQHEADRNIPGLIGDLDSQDLVIRNHVVRVLASLGAKEAVPHLVKLTDHPERNTRMAAYRALGQLRATEETRLLLHGLEDPEPLVRMAAAVGLWDMRDRSAIPRLRELLSSERDGDVRFRIAYALVRVGDKEVVEDLPQVLKGTPWRMRLSPEWKELKQLAESRDASS